ncbi:aldehyde dehydrogenase family protein [Mesorhizobium sp. M0016]|uniref:aldehyde dehydrogenase family protein n=1 Tax=Mesorhizobium sp. M0016 TaxID=2956843 RepID=UPI0033386C37
MLYTIMTARQALAALSDTELLRERPYVDGEWQGYTSATQVTDPATGDIIAHVGDCDASLVNRAIDAAQAAFGSWRDRLARDRGRMLLSWAELIRRHSRDLSAILTAEHGKPLAEAEAEILYGVDFIEWFAAEGERAYGETIPGHKPASRLFVSMQPVGVSAAVTPWNFPSAMIARKAAAALAAGCPVIVKPAVETPLSALALAELAHRAGLPRRVFQVVTGDPNRLTDSLLADERVRAFSFTGSTEVGRLLLAKAAATIKKVSMELGGHAPFIVFDDADLDEAVEGCVAAKFTTSGQDCLAANRIFVQAGNATEMGLAAYVYTRDLKRAMRLSDALEYGMVGINTASFTGAPIPFGGWKQSGLGREGSRQGLQEFMEHKYVCFGGLAA